MPDAPPPTDGAPAAAGSPPPTDGAVAAAGSSPLAGSRSPKDSDRARQRRLGGIDGITDFMGIRWEDPQTVRLTIRPELINAGGLLSGVATYALVDYCMGSTLWAQTTREERIATLNIAINYVQTATEGEIVCRTVLDRRNRRSAVLRSEVTHEDGRLLVTAIGSYTIFPPRPSDRDRPAAPAS
ncbi:MAG TPA: PaaI family thioesterase [Solirubrobacteraceae bacterium]|nr:PaaI family thioesterase [Solirubrobacteraceae bacterium]